MIFDRSLRSRQRSKTASGVKNQRRDRFRRELRLESLEKRCVLAAIVGPIADSFLANSALHAEGEAGEPDHHHGDLPTFKYLPTKYYQSNTDKFLSEAKSGTPEQVAFNYLRENAGKFGLSSADLDHLVIKNQYTTERTGVTHIYLKQKYNGLEIGNADLSINVSKFGEVINVGSTFVGNLAHPTQPQIPTPGIQAGTAFQEFADEFGYTFDGVPTVISHPQGQTQRTVLAPGGVASDNVVAELQYMATPNGLELAWRLVVPTADLQHWYDVNISATSGAVLNVSDWVDDASYNVFPIPVESPLDGVREVVFDPHDPVASPFGWHDANGRVGPEFFDTRGNNVWAQQDRDGLAFVGGAQTPTNRPTGGPNLNFNSPLDLTRPSSFFTDASVTNMFYLVNVAHDVHFHYGFDEASGNFQSLNYSKLGRGGDPVLALAQVGANLPVPINNAFMATPPDGFQPLMIMGEFNVDVTALQAPALPTYAQPRNSDLESGIVLHEFGHGVTNRLTGGAANSNALNAIQSGSMGEGWSDFFALWFLQRPTDVPGTSHPQGPFMGGPNALFPDKGIRRFPYSFDMTINPLTFGDFNGAGGATCATVLSNCEVHNAGEIWAQMLWDLNWILIEKYGYSEDLYRGQGGNNLTMQLVMDGLKLQPANPTFTQARDAILLADLIANDGINHREIWEAFARRGMGFSADADILDLGTQPPFNVFLDSPNSIFVREAFDIPDSEAQIQGRVWSDDNGNGLLDGNEQGLANVTVFIDTNSNGSRDALEPFTTTTATGNYQFDFFTPGTFEIAQEVPTGYQQTFPANNGSHTVTVVNNQTVTDINFGNRRGAPQATGIVFLDEDGDGRRHPFEPGMANVFVYADIDGDNRLDLAEPQTRTAADGTYTLTLSTPGTYFVRQSVPPGFVQTLPARDAGYQVTVVSGTLNANFEFGNTPAEDWGDAPLPFPTTTANNGAVHGFLPGFFLGTSVDLESNGTPSANATGDDATPIGADDEDGVSFTSSVFPGGTASVQVRVNLADRVTETVQGRTREVIRTQNAVGRLHAWLDFNRDGDWDDAGEKVFNDLLLAEGTHTLTFPVPRNATPGVTFARFRYGYEHILGPGGRAMAGEVEDHLVRILSETPDAIDDVFAVDQNSTANFLDVLANDVASSSGPLTIVSASATTNGGTVLVSPDRLSLRYTPRRGFIGNDSFTYTVRDPAGVTDTARVSVTVLPSFAQPIAVDDSFDVNENSVNNELNVLANDLVGRAPPIGIVSFLPPGNGTVIVDNRGTTTPSDDVLRYTPNVGFAGTDTFQYTIEDDAGQQSSATVTVHVQPGDSLDDLVQYRIEATDINDNPIAAVGVGETFKIRVYVDDLRADDGVEDGVDRRGVGAGYLDLLYPFNLISVSNTIDFSPEYNNATSGSTTTPGLINEAGALQSGQDPLGAEEILLFEITAVATGVGTARLVGDPADLTSENPGVPPEHDTLLFEPPNTVPIRQQRFVNSTLQIVGTGGRPQVIDNTFNVPANSVSFPLPVLANDVDRDNPPLRITAVGDANSTTFITPNGGRVTISPDNNQLLYTPRTGFSGTEQFTYTAANAVGLTSSAVVTVQVGSVPKDVNLRIDTTNSLGQHIDVIAQGSTFEVRVYVQDVRANPPDPSRMGVFAAYLDLLYDSAIVSTIGDINAPFGFRMNFGPEYTNGQSANNQLPNIIDELGAFQESFAPLGPSEFLLATITFRADRAGVANFVGDPANITPLHDVLLFEPADDEVNLSRIGYRQASIVVVGAEGEVSQFHNVSNRYDVNIDTVVSPNDALVVINALNSGGPRPLYAAGEGETPRMKIDVNGDFQLSPIDALQVINFLNKRGSGEGEAEVDAGPGLLDDDSAALAAADSVLRTTQSDDSTQDKNSDASEDAEVQIMTMTSTSNNQSYTRDRVFALLASSARLQDTDDSSEVVDSLLAEDIFEAWDKND